MDSLAAGGVLGGVRSGVLKGNDGSSSSDIRPSAALLGTALRGGIQYLRQGMVFEAAG